MKKQIRHLTELEILLKYKLDSSEFDISSDYLMILFRKCPKEKSNIDEIDRIMNSYNEDKTIPDDYDFFEESDLIRNYNNSMPNRAYKGRMSKELCRIYGLDIDFEKALNRTYNFHSINISAVGVVDFLSSMEMFLDFNDYVKFERAVYPSELSLVF